MPYSDPEEQRAAQQQHYQTHKQDYLQRSNSSREKRRAWVRDQKNTPCVDCGVQYPYYVMQFDHRDATTKVGAVAALTSLSSWSKLKAEVDKCDLVCGNCHAERGHQRRCVLQSIENKLV